MHADLAMIHKTFLALVDELDWIFYCNNMVLSSPVRIVNDCGQSRRLAAARRARNKDHAFVQGRELFHDRRKAKLFSREHLGWNLPENRRRSVFLVEKVRTVTCFSRNFITKVDVTGFLKDFDFEFRRNFIKHFFQMVVFQRWELDALQFAANSQNWLRARGQMQVRCSLLIHQVEKCVNLCHESPSLKVT